MLSLCLCSVVVCEDGTLHSGIVRQELLNGAWARARALLLGRVVPICCCPLHPLSHSLCTVPDAPPQTDKSPLSAQDAGERGPSDQESQASPALRVLKPTPELEFDVEQIFTSADASYVALAGPRHEARGCPSY